MLSKFQLKLISRFYTSKFSRQTNTPFAEYVVMWMVIQGNNLNLEKYCLEKDSNVIQMYLGRVQI